MRCFVACAMMEAFVATSLFVCLEASSSSEEVSGVAVTLVLVSKAAIIVARPSNESTMDVSFMSRSAGVFEAHEWLMASCTLRTPFDGRHCGPVELNCY